MSLDPIIVEAGLPQPLVARLDARARKDGISRAREIERLVTRGLADHDQGEMRHPHDVAGDDEWVQRLPGDQELL